MDMAERSDSAKCTRCSGGVGVGGEGGGGSVEGGSPGVHNGSEGLTWQASRDHSPAGGKICAQAEARLRDAGQCRLACRLQCVK